MRPHRPLLAAALTITLTLAGASAAQPSPKEEADALFKEGRAAVLKGDYPTACARFRKSDELDPALGTRFNLADCEDHLGHVATAAALFREVAQKFAPGDERLPVANERLAALEKRLPRLRVRLAEAARGASVTRDGAPLAPADLDAPIPLDPGHHTLSVAASGHETRAYDVLAKEAETIDLTVALGPAIAPVATAVPAPDSGVTRRKLGFVAGGLGVASIGVGVVTGILAIADKSTVDRLCDKAEHCSQQAGIEAASDGRTVSAISTATFVAGAVLVAAGVVLVLTSGAGSKTVVAPSAGPQGAGLQLTRSF